MSTPTSRHNPLGRREWLHRFDRAAADMNALLFVFAIGLAALDVTFLFSERIIDRLPQVTRIVDVEQPAASQAPSNGTTPQ